MKPETEQLLATVEVLIQGLSAGIGSEGDEPFQAFVFEEATDKNNFTISEHLHKLNYFRYVEINTFLQEWQRKLPNHLLKSQMSKQYSSLIQVLQAHLLELQVYELITDNEGNCLDKVYSDDEPFLILIGQTKANDWVGLSPLWSAPHTCGYGKRLERKIQPPSQAALDLKAELEPILQELLFVIGDSSRGYYPVKDIVWKVAHTKALLIEQLLESSRYMKTWEFHGFSDEYSQRYRDNEYFDNEVPEQEIQMFEEGEELWWQQYEIEGYGKLESENWIKNWDLNGVKYEFYSLEKFMFDNLRNRRIYVMGNSAIFRIYVVGRTKESDWLGISTKAVWT
ncbi:MAG: nuclease A inhibitor family protein [Nostoc sp.]|uniref:nuclease A inhibitor family protein n=1 Tax=Nostoc sp. TaxID=1180 RepID=UPI002FF96E03